MNSIYIYITHTCYIHIYIYICYIGVYIDCIYIYIYMKCLDSHESGLRVGRYARMHACMHACICMYIYIYMHMCIYIHILRCALLYIYTGTVTCYFSCNICMHAYIDHARSAHLPLSTHAEPQQPQWQRFYNRT